MTTPLVEALRSRAETLSWGNDSEWTQVLLEQAADEIERLSRPRMSEFTVTLPEELGPLIDSLTEGRQAALWGDNRDEVVTEILCTFFRQWAPRHGS